MCNGTGANPYKCIRPGPRRTAWLRVRTNVRGCARSAPSPPQLAARLAAKSAATTSAWLGARPRPAFGRPASAAPSEMLPSSWAKATLARSTPPLAVARTASKAARTLAEPVAPRRSLENSSTEVDKESKPLSRDVEKPDNSSCAASSALRSVAIAPDGVSRDSSATCSQTALMRTDSAASACATWRGPSCRSEACLGAAVKLREASSKKRLRPSSASEKPRQRSSATPRLSFAFSVTLATACGTTSKVAVAPVTETSAVCTTSSAWPSMEKTRALSSSDTVPLGARSKACASTDATPTLTLLAVSLT
mmetsp:Transcript_53804/g.149250  ORF Transcript_53804/g.149250 Transcript_53804/m.149250 type:complete len:308 (+) Transcript_53804:108-1031(+)